MEAGVGACATHVDALFCEDFESGNFDRWTSVSGDLARTDVEAHEGRHALAVSATEVGTLAATFSAVTEDILFVRAYVRRDLMSVTEAVTLLSLEAVDDANWYTEVFATNNDVGAYLQWGSDAGSNESASGAADLKQRWSCLTWEVDIDRGEIRLTRDGALIAMLEPTGDVAPDTGYDRLIVGVRDNAEQSAEGTWYFDAIVVDDAPIPCDP